MAELPRRFTVEETEILIARARVQNMIHGNKLHGLLYITIEAGCPATGISITDINQLPSEPEPYLDWGTFNHRDPYLRRETLSIIFGISLNGGLCCQNLKQLTQALQLPIDFYNSYEVSRRVRNVPLVGRFETINNVVYQTAGNEQLCHSIPFYRR